MPKRHADSAHYGSAPRKVIHREKSYIEATSANQYFFYRGNDIVKLWEQYLKAANSELETGIRFYIDEGSSAIESIFNGMTQLQEKAIVINRDDGLLYKNSDGKTVSLCGEVDYTHRGINGVNKILEAFEQVTLYNFNHATKITNHLIIFPYHATPNHWNLGQIELAFDESGNLSETTIAIYEPFGGNASNRYSLVAAINELGFLGAVTMTPQPINQPKQQNDGSSCGAITAENGKEFLKKAGDDDFLARTYPQFARELRERHITEINNEAFTIAQRDDIAYDAKGDKPLENLEAVTKILSGCIARPENDWIKEVISRIKSTDNERRECLDLFKMFLIQLDLSQMSLSSTHDKISSLILNSDGSFKDGAIDLIESLESSRTEPRKILGGATETKMDESFSTIGSTKKSSEFIYNGDVVLRVSDDASDSKVFVGINFISPDKPIPHGHPDHFPTIFNGARGWKDIPQLAVITGQNGQGKSQLLKYIYHVLTRADSLRSKIREKACFNQDEVLYISPDDNLIRQVSATQHTDTSSDLRRKDIWMPQVKASYETGFRVEPQNSYAKLVCKTLKPQIESKKSRGEWNEANLEFEILSAVKKTIDYSQYLSNDKKLSSSPISFLGVVFQAYLNRVDINRNDTNNYTGTLWLYDYYRSLSIEELKVIDPRITSNALELRQFMEFMTRDSHEAPQILGNLAQSYALRESGSSPIDEINIVLRKYGFKYTISFEPPDEEIRTHERKLFLEKDGHIIEPESLSSGEKLILSLLSWKYRIDGLASSSPDSQRKVDNKIKIILLDEFDSHFDPKLCELFLKIIKEEFVEKAGIQVIMATHRIDTVALAPKESIFVIEDTGGHAEIVKCHPLQAMFRMTSNVRSLIDFYFKVYTEGVRDAWFYEGVYSSLRVYCDENRSSENTDHIWSLDDDHMPRLLSRRYEMSFHTTSTQGKGGGNCSVVKDSVMRDRRSLEISREGLGSVNKRLLSKQKHMFDEAELYASYGIIDHDGLPSHGLEEKHLEKSVEVLKRYSIENFIFDPIVICSVLASLDTRSTERAEIIRAISGVIKSGEEKEYVSLFEEINTSIEAKEYDKVQDFISSVFNLFFERIRSKFIENMCHKIKSIDSKKVDMTELKSKITSKADILLEDVLIISNNLTGKNSANYKKTGDLLRRYQDKLSYDIEEVSIIINSNEVITLKYPKIFNEICGHMFEEFLFEEFAGLIVQQVRENGLKYIPYDLAEVFFHLNGWIRESVRSVIKPKMVVSFSEDTSTADDNDHPMNSSDVGTFAGVDSGLHTESL